jgi:hypothetical protein
VARSTIQDNLKRAAAGLAWPLEDRVTDDALESSVQRVGGRIRIPEAQSEVRAGLAMNPTFTIARLRASRSSDNPTAAAGGERLIDGLRKAGVLEE